MFFSFFFSNGLNALPRKIKINSVKSLTYILSTIEKEIGNEARYVFQKVINISVLHPLRIISRVPNLTDPSPCRNRLRQPSREDRDP